MSTVYNGIKNVLYMRDAYFVCFGFIGRLIFFSGKITCLYTHTRRFAQSTYITIDKL